MESKKSIGYVCQDLPHSKTLESCKFRATNFLKKKKLSVIIDRCNQSVKERKHWIDIALQVYKTNLIYCVRRKE